jgi:hypothetical protein
VGTIEHVQSRPTIGLVETLYLPEGAVHDFSHRSRNNKHFNAKYPGIVTALGACLMRRD